VGAGVLEIKGAGVVLEDVVGSGAVVDVVCSGGVVDVVGLKGATVVFEVEAAGVVPVFLQDEVHGRHARG
jgi:hypothetical protein